MANKLQNVILGSGLVYVAPWTSGAISMDTVAVEANLIGYTSGGCTLTYTPETKTIEDDCGYVRRSFSTKSNATLKTGLLTYSLESLNAAMSLGTYNSTTKTLTLGGGKAELRKFAVVFVHYDDAKKADLRVGMIATNTAAFELAFDKENETIPDLEFTAESNGVNDVIVTIDEGPQTTQSSGT